jgi:thiamine-monophosphate kinase
MKVSDLGEDRVIAELTKGLRLGKRVLLGPGDDCAVVKVGHALQLLKTDSIIEGVHFLVDADARWVGWKALCRAISDIAAMGAVPCAALITIAIPATTDLAWLRRLYEGIERAARKYGVSVVGGETSRSTGPVFLSVFLTGSPVRKDRFILRSGAKSGDAIFVTGRLGGSLSGHHLKFSPRLPESSWLAKEFPVHAMMDISDGLAADLPRMAHASGLGFCLERGNIPLNPGCTLEQGLQDGEDYELLFAVPPRIIEPLEQRWKKKFPRVRLSHIGQFRKGATNSIGASGWDHFAAKSLANKGRDKEHPTNSTRK